MTKQGVYRNEGRRRAWDRERKHKQRHPEPEIQKETRQARRLRERQAKKPPETPSGLTQKEALIADKFVEREGYGRAALKEAINFVGVRNSI